MSEVYDKIGFAYDTTRKADPEIIRRLYHHLQLGVGSSVIDIGCGTGNYTMTLKKYGLATGWSLLTLYLSNSCRKKEFEKPVESD